MANKKKPSEKQAFLAEQRKAKRGIRKGKTKKTPQKDCHGNCVLRGGVRRCRRNDLVRPGKADDPAAFCRKDGAL
ncbi:MAG: hypothetical protein ACLTXT_03255 [Ruminococcus callidus]